MQLTIETSETSTIDEDQELGPNIEFTPATNITFYIRSS